MTDSQGNRTDDEALFSYLQSHVMAADSGSQIFEEARKVWEESPYGARVQALSADVEQDRQELKAITAELGAELSAPKAALSSIARAFSHLNPLNLTRSRSGVSGHLELEGLYTAVSGKECLWRTLEQLSQTDNRFSRAQQQRLIERAVDQQNRIMELIRETASFRPGTSR